MKQVTLQIELPEHIAARLGETLEAATEKAKLAVALHLLWEGVISQGWAAELLGVTRHDIIDLMAKYEIPSGPRTVEEWERERETIDRLLRERKATSR